MDVGARAINVFGLLHILYVNLLPALGVDRDRIHESLVEVGLRHLLPLGCSDEVVALDDSRGL